ncbi:unnamed protein product [Toxocara canis]|uniref:RRM domain-containing protein n=1 Tax=Toxocara canis TaxID=6265 RepID=A0A183U0F5_TOXCA|nr:unnamed protein product [Toxocara canis]
MEPNLIRSQDRDTGKVASAIKAEVEIHEGNEVKTKDDEQKERQRSTKTLEKEGTLSAKSGSQPQLTNALLKSNHSLWIRGIGADTKAAHLKTMFANCGRVVTAKVFVRRQKPANVYFGFIAMVNTECADECVRQFHKAILNGQQITVERADRVDMAVRIPEAKKENKASTAVMKEEGTEIAKGKEDSEKMKGGEKRSASAAKSNVEIKRQSSENGARKGLAKVKQVARRPEHSRPNTQFSSASNRNERRSARNIFRAHQRVRTMRSLPTQCAIRKPVRPLITTKPARWFQYAPSRRGRSDGRFAVPQSYGHSGGPPPFASVPPSFPSIKPVMGSLPHGNVPKPISPLMSRSRDGGGFGGYHVRNLSGGAGGPSRRDFSRSRSPLPARFGQPTVTPWEKNETAEMVRRKQEGFRLREEERHLQEERDRLRHERECIERERILLEKQQMEREQRARDEMERAHRERIAVERENAERSRAERECVARGRAERESIIVGREQQARHEKERVVQERLRIEREHDRFRMKRERTGRIKAEQERRAERLRAEQERARSERLRVEQERARAERLRVEQERARAERLRVEQERAAEQRRIRTERERVEHERAAAERERLRAERERVEKELAERQRLAVERERAEKERAERERLRLERERAERERLQLERLRAESERERKRAEADRERLRTAETAKRGQAPEFGRQPDRLKTQMERMERERLELEQLRQLAALTASQVMSTFAPDARSAREGAAAHQGIGVSR